MKKIYAAAINNYTPQAMDEFLKSRDLGGPQKHKKNITIQHTGSGPLRQELFLASCLEDMLAFGCEIDMKNNEYYSELSKKLIDTTKKNTGEWLKNYNDNKCSEADILEQTMNTILFEIKYLGVFDTETYFHYIAKTLKLSSEKKERLALIFLEQLENSFEKFRINYVPFLTLDSYFIDFYAKHFSKILFNERHVTHAYNQFNLKYLEPTEEPSVILQACLRYISASFGYCEDKKTTSLLKNWLSELQDYVTSNSLSDTELKKIKKKFDESSKEEKKEKLPTFIFFKPEENAPKKLTPDIQKDENKEEQKNTNTLTNSKNNLDK
jgi:hypothetical protein